MAAALFLHLLLAHLDNPHIVPPIDNNRCIDVLLVVDVQLMGGGHHQMPVAQSEVDDTLRKVQHILCAISNVLQGNRFATRARCLQIT